MEWFKEIKKTNYSIDNVGNVINNKTKKILRPYINKGGYYTVKLNNNSTKLGLVVHREVAKIFCKNKNNLPIVNHVDGNKLNNHHSNLEWCTIRENTIHAYDIGLNSLAVSVDLIDLKNNTTKKYTSIQGLGNYLGIDNRLLIGRIKRSKEYPILDRYIIEVLDEDKLFKNSNSLNFGRVLYVYDYITDKHTKYPSLGQLMYVTGIRSPLDTSKETLFSIGFIISSNPIDKVIPIEEDIKSVKLKREKYYSKKYVKRETVYYIIDLVSVDKTEHKFSDITDLRNFMSEASKHDMSATRINWYKKQPGYDSRFIRGFNIVIWDKNYKGQPKYAKYTYERAYNAREGTRYKRPVYEVIINNHTTILSTTYSVIEFLRKYISKNDPILDTSVTDIDDNYIQKSVNNDNIKISRLNKIMI